MSKYQHKTLISEANSALSQASYAPRRLVLIHTGVIAAASLIAMLLSYLLSAGSSSAGGLSGIGTQAALETAESVFSLAISLLSPFWSAGLISVAIRLARREDPQPHTLMDGLRRWGPILRLLLLQILLYFAVTMVLMQVLSYVYLFMPFSQGLSAVVEQMYEEGILESMDVEAIMEAILALDTPTLVGIIVGMVLVVGLPCLVVIAYLSYRMRFATYVLLDGPRVGALYALIQSFRLTRRNTLSLFLLDLRFWWFYLLELAVAAVSYAYLFLPTASMNAELAAVICCVASLVLQLALYAWKKPQVVTTYALFYDRLNAQQPERT